MKKLILLTLASVLSFGAMADDWTVQGSLESGSLHLSCGASVGHNSTVTCGDLTIGGGEGATVELSPATDEEGNPIHQAVQITNPDGTRIDAATDEYAREVHEAAINADWRGIHAQESADSNTESIEDLKIVDEVLMEKTTENSVAIKVEQIERQEAIKEASKTTLESANDYTDTKAQETKQYAQDAAKEAESNSKSYTNSEVGKLDNKFTEDQQRQDREFSEYQVVQSKVDSAQSKVINDNTNRLTEAEQELYATTARSKSNAKRLDNVEVEIAGIHNDITRLDGMMAANAAANAIILPSGFNGNLAVGVGIGSYRGHSGLSFGAVHDGGDYAVKVTVSGTDADNWNDLQYGASVNFTTDFFD